MNSVNLFNGRLIHFDKNIDAFDRVMINTGTHTLSSSSEHLAFVPNSDWRALSSTEASALIATDYTAEPSPDRVQIFRILDRIDRWFDNIRESILRYNRLDYLENIVNTPAYLTARDGLLQLLDETYPSLSFKYLGYNITAPEQETVSVIDNKRLVGLHIDAWGVEDIASRTGYPCRLVANVGPEKRFFHYINLSIEDIKLRDSSIPTNNPNIFVENFLQKNPHYPVIKVKLLPGEAYIAPTEILIHDASTLGKNYYDFVFTVLVDR